MGDGMTMQDRASLDDHITGGGSPGINEGGEYLGAPIILAWEMLDKQHAPTAAQITEAINKAIEGEGYHSVTAITLLKNYFSSSIKADADQARSYREFARGFEAGVEQEALNCPNPHDGGHWENDQFSYMLGHLAGDFTADSGWATPFEADDDDPVETEE